MLTQETKQHIDSARQILVGVIPNPLSQVQQITNALIYKFMDDMDQSAIKQGGAPSFFTSDLKKYSWVSLMDSRVGNQDRVNLYSEALTKFSQAKQLPELFRNIFKTASLPYRNPEVLGLFLKEINYFDYKHSEELGNAYEYLLSIMGSQGDAGQFRTPRHIIDFIVKVVGPTKDDKILDPACGTAGFLISAYKYILSQHSGENGDSKKNNEKPLTPDQKRKLSNNFFGYDVSPEMVQLSRVNMYLHKFTQPNISEYNTLADDEKWNDKFSVILANPPFNSISSLKAHSKFSLKTKIPATLFTEYMLNHLNPQGRMGVIVPEGVIFKLENPTKQLRKMLLENGLYSVVSLPAGVFKPYSGVKTYILFLDKEIAKNKKEVLFLKIEKEGYELGDTRRPLSTEVDDPAWYSKVSDLPEALDILNNWKINIKVENNLTLFTEKTKIAENGDYNFLSDRYRIAKEYSSIKWPMMRLEEVLDYEQPTDYIVESVDYKDSYPTPVLTAGKSFILGYTNEQKGIFHNELPVIIFDDFTTAIKFVDFSFKVKSSAMKILHAKKEKANIKFIYYVMQKIKFAPSEHKRYWISQYSKFKIPIPPLKVQEQMVKELDSYQSIITSAKQIVSNWKSLINIDPKWEKVKLGEVLETSSGGTPLKSKNEYYDGGTIPWITSGEVSQGLILKATQFITKDGLKNSSAKKFPVNTVLVAMYGATIGQVGILGIEATTNQAVCGIFPDSKYIPKFLYYFLLQQKENFVSLGAGGAQPNISQNIIRNLEIPNISIKIQQKIIDQIESEQTLVEGNKKLIEIYEEKIKVVLSKLWEE